VTIIPPTYNIRYKAIASNCPIPRRHYHLPVANDGNSENIEFFLVDITPFTPSL